MIPLMLMYRSTTLSTQQAAVVLVLTGTTSTAMMLSIPTNIILG
jgi:hypothetical protein